MPDSKPTRTVDNHMNTVWCPVAQANVPANSTKNTRGSGEYRCTRCGQIHRRG